MNTASGKVGGQDVHLLSEVNNGAFLSSVCFGVLVLGGKSSEKTSVLIGGSMLFSDFGHWDGVGVLCTTVRLG